MYEAFLRFCRNECPLYEVKLNINIYQCQLYEVCLTCCLKKFHFARYCSAQVAIYEVCLMVTFQQTCVVSIAGRRGTECNTDRTDRILYHM